MDIIETIKNFNWSKILETGRSLDCFNTGQWRFLKGVFIEKSLEKYNNTDLIYVGETQDHYDYVWPSQNLTLELKSVTSSKMYKKNGDYKKNYKIMLNNSMGTNNKNDAFIADFIIAVYSDGVFLISKDVAEKNLIHKGDGFNIIVTSDQIIPIFKTTSNNKTDSLLGIKDTMLKVIENHI